MGASSEFERIIAVLACLAQLAIDLKDRQQNQFTIASRAAPGAEGSLTARFDQGEELALGLNCSAISRAVELCHRSVSRLVGATYLQGECSL